MSCLQIQLSESKAQTGRNVLDVLFLEMSFDRCPSGVGVRCRVTRPAMKAAPIFFFEANAGVFELGHLSKFHDPPFGCTFARRFLIPARDLHTPSLSRPEQIDKNGGLTHEATPADDRHS